MKKLILFILVALLVAAVVPAALAQEGCSYEDYMMGMCGQPMEPTATPEYDPYMYMPEPTPTPAANFTAENANGAAGCVPTPYDWPYVGLRGFCTGDKNPNAVEVPAPAFGWGAHTYTLRDWGAVAAGGGFIAWQEQHPNPDTSLKYIALDSAMNPPEVSYWYDATATWQVQTVTWDSRHEGQLKSAVVLTDIAAQAAFDLLGNPAKEQNQALIKLAFKIVGRFIFAAKPGIDALCSQLILAKTTLHQQQNACGASGDTAQAEAAALLRGRVIEAITKYCSQAGNAAWKVSTYNDAANAWNPLNENWGDTNAFLESDTCSVNGE